MQPFALFVVLGACVVSATAYSKCDPKLIEEIKKNLKETPIDLKFESLKTDGNSLIATTTAFFFGIGTKCATTHLSIDDKFKVNLYDAFCKETNQPEVQLKKDDKCNEYYTVNKEGAKTYTIPYYEKDGVMAAYTCSDKEPKDKQEDSIKDASIRIRVDLSKSDAEEVVKKAKAAVEEAKKIGEEKYKFIFTEDYSPEECVKKIKEKSVKKDAQKKN